MACPFCTFATHVIGRVRGPRLETQVVTQITPSALVIMHRTVCSGYTIPIHTLITISQALCIIARSNKVAGAKAIRARSPYVGKRECLVQIRPRAVANPGGIDDIVEKTHVCSRGCCAEVPSISSTSRVAGMTPLKQDPCAR